MTRARRTAIPIASTYSRSADFRLGFASVASAAVSGADGAGTVTPIFVGSISILRSSMFSSQHREECLLRHFDATHLFHAPLAFLLSLEELALACDIAAVALGGDVLAHRLHGLARDDAAADRGLDGHLEELARDDRAEPLDQRLALLVRLVPVDDDRERVDGLAVEQDVELDEIRGAEVRELVVERRDRKSTRLNSSHLVISYAVFCLKKKKQKQKKQCSCEQE